MYLRPCRSLYDPTYPSRETTVQQTLSAGQPLLARQTHIFDLLHDLRLFLCSVLLRSQRRLLDDMRTTLRRLFGEHEFSDLAILPSGTWLC
jgi:hypothetical protein